MLRRGLSHTTVIHAHRLLSKILSDALKWGLIARNVAQAVEPPSPVRKEMSTLDREEVQRLLAEVEGTEWYALYHLAIFTGLRRSELLGLRWGDVDLEHQTLRVVQTLHELYDGRVVIEQPKTAKSRRSVALTPASVEVLRAHRAQPSAFGAERLVFCQFDGTPLHPDYVTSHLIRTAARVGYRIRLHDLRHTHASALLAEGVHPKIVQERLGHSTIAITLDTYSHVAPGLQEAAARKFDHWLAPREKEA